nr:flagellin FliC [Desulfobulbaceae bacterium]
MAFKITNTSSLISASQLLKGQQDLQSSLEKLSSGSRINKAADDAASLSIANQLGSQARGYGQAIRNANDTVSILQIADGSLDEAASLVSSIRERSLQAANGSQSLESKQALQADIDKSLQQLDNIAKNTSFNGQDLLSGSFTNKQFQVGANANETISVSISSVDPSQLGGESGQLSEVNVLTAEGAQAAIKTTDAALQQINSSRAEIGSQQNKLTSTVSNLSTSRINTLSAESTIRDLDFAEEIMNLSKMKVLNEVRAFASSQANASSQNIVNLLQGEK